MVGIPAPIQETDRFASTAELEAEIGAQFRRARLNRGLSQDELGARAGVGKTAIKDLEAGRGSSLKTMVRIARVLGEVETWLLSLSPEPTISPIAAMRERGLLRESKRAPRRTKPKGDA